MAMGKQKRQVDESGLKTVLERRPGFSGLSSKRPFLTIVTTSKPGNGTRFKQPNVSVHLRFFILRFTSYKPQPIPLFFLDVSIAFI